MQRIIYVRRRNEVNLKRPRSLRRCLLVAPPRGASIHHRFPHPKHSVRPLAARRPLCARSGENACTTPLGCRAILNRKTARWAVPASSGPSQSQDQTCRRPVRSLK
jgi:hypothetical protein